MQQRSDDQRGQSHATRRPERPKRGHGEGSIDELAPGRWRGRLMLEGRRYPVYGESREAVIDAMSDIRRRLRKGLPVSRAPEARRRTGDHLRHWLEGRRGTLAERSWANHERYIALHLIPALGSVPLAALAADHLRRLYGQLVRPQGTLSAKSVREVHGTIRQALQQAVDDGLLERNVATLVKLPKSEARTRQYVLPPDQLSRFWRVAQNDRLYALWRLAALVPSRSGELRALAWDDLDERNGLLFIRRSVRCSGDGGRALETKAPKTAAGARLIDLDDELLEALRQHRRRQARGAAARRPGLDGAPARLLLPLGDAAPVREHPARLPPAARPGGAVHPLPRPRSTAHRGVVAPDRWHSAGRGGAARRSRRTADHGRTLRPRRAALPHAGHGPARRLLPQRGRGGRRGARRGGRGRRLSARPGSRPAARRGPSWSRRVTGAAGSAPARRRRRTCRLWPAAAGPPAPGPWGATGARPPPPPGAWPALTRA